MDCQDRFFIEERIPHRPPFLWVDKVLEIDDEHIRAEKLIPENLEIFQGHYPNYPIMPGVLLCEAIFQTGALLISERIRSAHGRVLCLGQSIPVLTRILGAKFKREVKPGERIELTVQFKDQVGPAWFLKGSVKVNGKVAVQVEFACIRKSEMQ